MTLVSDIITAAYRETNIIGLGTLPSGNQSEEGLDALNRILMSSIGQEAGEEFSPVVVGTNNISRPSGYPYYNPTLISDWFVPDNTRLLLNLSQATTVALDPNPHDGARFALIDKSLNLATYPLTVSGNGRTIGGANSVVYNANGANYEYLYRADLGDWVITVPLSQEDLWPFPIDFDDMFITALSFRLNPRYQLPADGQSVAAYKRSVRQFKARYRQRTNAGLELALLRTPGTRGRALTSNITTPFFNLGFFPYGIRF